jgi:hypothetical protein
VPALVVVAVNVCAIVDPLPALAPETFDCTTVHEKVVPVTLLVSTIDVAVPEQIACVDGVAVTIGVGFTVTVIVNVLPVQLPDVGVTVYVAV